MILQLNCGSYNQYSDDFQKLSFGKANIKLTYSEVYEMGSHDKKRNIIDLWMGRNEGRGAKLELAKIINNSLLPLVFCLFGLGFFGIFAKPNRALSFLVTMSVISFYYTSRIIGHAGAGPYLEASFPNILISIIALFFIYRSGKR